MIVGTKKNEYLEIAKRLKMLEAATQGDRNKKAMGRIIDLG